MDKDLLAKVVNRYTNLVLFLVSIVVIGAIVVISNPFPFFVVQKSLVASTKTESHKATEMVRPDVKDLFEIPWIEKLSFLDTNNIYEANVLKGYNIITHTSKYLGPNSNNPKAGNDLNCTNCHLKSGTQKFAAPFIGIYSRFPQYRGRENEVGDLKDRINGCMERSMNGEKLELKSDEMMAMVSYMHWLSQESTQGDKLEGKGFKKFNFPNRKVDLKNGKEVYEQKCASCHQLNGAGKKDDTGWYVYPPLAGANTYNDGAGMHRVLTAAAFIKNNMPLGATYNRPILSDEEAFDVAGYINTLNRPSKKDKEKDFPDLKRKPMSTPYGPWLDEFSAEQHKLGPFGPIKEFYKNEFNIAKTK